MIRSLFCEILQDLHFADNRKDDKTEKAFKIKAVIDHLKLEIFEGAIKWYWAKHWWTHGEIQRQILNEAVNKIKTNKMEF